MLQRPSAAYPGLLFAVAHPYQRRRIRDRVLSAEPTRVLHHLPRAERDVLGGTLVVAAAASAIAGWSDIEKAAAAICRLRIRDFSSESARRKKLTRSKSAGPPVEFSARDRWMWIAGTSSSKATTSRSLDRRRAGLRQRPERMLTTDDTDFTD